MREYRVVRAGDVVTERLLDPADEGLDNLYANMLKVGMQDPILVDENLHLIDGRRRLGYFQPDEMIDVVISDHYDDTLQIMTLQKGKPFTSTWSARRFWDYYEGVRAQRDRRIREYLDSQRGRKRSDNYGKKLPRSKRDLTRSQMSTFTGRASTWIQAVIFLYARGLKLTQAETPELQQLTVELVKKMDAGYNPYSARHDYEKAKQTASGAITSASEQRQILKRGSAAGNALTRVLTDFATINDGISVAEAEEFLRSFQKVRTDITVITNRLKERIRKG